MARAVIGTTVLAESSEVVLVEGNRYFPPAAVGKDLLTEGNREYACPWKGKATYWDINAEGKVYRNAAWSYESPKEAARSITGHVAFDTSVVTVGD
jgi:uncharacterized protein (DUF427 family)